MDEESIRQQRLFDLKRKHVFILSSAGKPIFSRHGDEQQLVTTFGLIQAVISIVEDKGDHIKCIRSKQRVIVYFVRHSLYFVLISSTGENESILNLQLQFMYELILVILTGKVHDILSANQSRDIRDLLGPETTRLLHASCAHDVTSPYISFQCVKAFTMPSDLRSDINQLTNVCVEESGSALGILVHNDTVVSYKSNSLTLDTSDVQLLCHFVCNANSLRSHDQNWVPICLPNFNSKAYMQAYMCKIVVRDMTGDSIELFLVLIASVAESSAFKDLHDNRLIFEKELSKQSITSRLVPLNAQQVFSATKFLMESACLHFFFKYRPHIGKDGNSIFTQGISSEFHISLDSNESQERIWIAYQTLALILRAGSSLPEHTLPSTVLSTDSISSSSNVEDEYESHVMSTVPVADHSLNYIVLNSGLIVVGMASASIEIFAAFPGSVTALDACAFTKHLSSAIRSEAANLFVI